MAFSIVALFLISSLLPVINSQSITKIETENSTCDLLIIAPSEFERFLKPLVCHKNKVGVNTKIVTLDYIYDDIWYGRDKAEKIKYFIRDAIEESGIKYVLFVGGIKKQFTFDENWWLPVRYIHIEDWWSGFDGPLYEPSYLSDLYFADIYDSEGNFSTWDADGDGIYGEWNNNNSADDPLDLYPDVYVGRLPCRNWIEVMIMVKKIIKYEKGDLTDTDWFNRMVVVAGDTYDGEPYEGEVETQDALDLMPDFEHVKLWISNGNLTGPEDVIREVNRGCGFLYFAGHGSPAVWGTHDPTKDKLVTGLHNFDMPKLLNGDKLSICIVGGCHNSLFNVGLFHTTWNGALPVLECFSWRLTRKVCGGTIATLGNTALGYGPKDKFNPDLWGGGGNLTNFFFEEYSLNENDILGECWGKAIGYYLDDFPIQWHERSYNDTSLDAKTVTEWALFGDPSLKIGGYNLD